MLLYKEFDKLYKVEETGALSADEKTK